MSHHFCIDRILPSETERPLHGRIVQLQSGPARAAFEIAKLWPNKSNIRIRFLNGTAAQQAMVKQFAPQWTQHANLNFVFDGSMTAQVRISFNANDGAWSYLGIDCLKIPLNQPTLNLGWQTEGVILHEFGHMVGLIHEHQAPIDNPIQWNREKVIEDLSGPPNNWTVAQIESNVFRRYETSQINGSTFDPKSIMLYSFPAAWTVNGFHTEPNDVLSDLDKEFAKKVYPGRGAVEPPAPSVNIPVSEIFVVKGAIGQAGEEDLYTFVASQAGRYTIETDGTTDLVMSLYSELGVLLGQDDDSGVGRNPSITKELIAGSYRLQVRHYNATRGTGSYGIKVVKS